MAKRKPDPRIKEPEPEPGPRVKARKPGPALRAERHGEFARQRPRVAVLTDQALAPAETYRDSFNLRSRVGPIYDILRHPDTRTPMAIAIYGDWGAGKTTAMKWLHGLLDIWNKQGEAERKYKVRPVWFYPWKYHTKQDVWRGLVAEVILRSIDVSEATLGRVTKAAKQFGLFLGRSFVHALAGVKLKAETPGGGTGAEVSLASIREILDEYREAAHPEKAYLNDFEDSLRTWVADTIRDNERMVIFIDDLDRCMPEVALQVLEALKLYLNIERLIFVVGVDRPVIQELVKKHYEKLGLGPEKSKNYLAKMFQVEVELTPTEQQIEEFLDQQLEELGYWREQLSETELAIFRSVILNLAGQNPREVKRLINSATMEGIGALIATEVEA